MYIHTYVVRFFVVACRQRKRALVKRACLNNEVYGLKPAGAAIKTIDSRPYAEKKGEEGSDANA